MDADLPEAAAPAGRSRTLRYFSTELASYALALVHLLEYARANPGQQFVFGPMDLSAARAGGLVLSGHDLAGAAAVLSRVEGLELYEPGAEPVPARLSGRAGLGIPRG